MVSFSNGTIYFFEKRMKEMKKVLLIAASALIMLSTFAGCGGNNNNGNNMATDVSEGMSNIVGGAESMLGDTTNGAVTDGDGIIGNEKETQSNTQQTTQSTTDNRNDINSTAEPTDSTDALV